MINIEQTDAHDRDGAVERPSVVGVIMIALSLVIFSIGLLVTGYSLLFSRSSFARTSGASIVAAAAIVVGGLVSAPLYGGKPYGFDLERFNQPLEAPSPPERERPRKREPTIARVPLRIAAG